MNKVLELKRTIKDSIAPNSNVIFNTASPYSEGITYDPITGEVTLPEIGQYTVRWWVSTETSLLGSIQFALKSSQGDLVVGCSPIKQGQVGGFADIYAKTPNVKLSLVNSGTSKVYLSKSSPVTASLLATSASGSGLAGSIIPFSLGKYGTYFAVYEDGSPYSVYFTGFGGSVSEATELAPGNWDDGIIDASSDYSYGISFVAPHDVILKKIHLFASNQDDQITFPADIRAFACVAVSPTAKPTFTILKDSIAYTETYEKNTTYPIHEIKKGVSNDVNIKIEEGSVVGIIIGITAEKMPPNPTSTISAHFVTNGAIYLE